MSAYIRLIYDKLDFLEFKQKILFLKEPQHKATVFINIELEDFLNIRNFTNDFQLRIEAGEKLSISDYEKELFEVYAPIKSFPSSSKLVAKALLNEDIFNSLFKYSN
ncbi:hypothetical protein CHF27_010270 [Romboutsia maritimum]|uniref:Uncharacterized protein n=1 Tax=Romboutsia maritimum TaxID=2020948 RepID=A0A371IRF0_9FIRM|nr:hypothetical protein [Romboutsia maritimum]RDY23057.1 hypothetical protein CHF27_010270 [Romboutsia maritimum]